MDSFTLELDREMTNKLKTGNYLVYRSKEMSGNEPIITGFYIQNSYFLLQDIPEEISISIRY